LQKYELPSDYSLISSTL